MSKLAPDSNQILQIIIQIWRNIFN